MQTKCKIKDVKLCSIIYNFAVQKQTVMKHILLLMASCIVLGCSTENNGRNSEGNVGLLKHCRVVTDEGEAKGGKQFTLNGVWTLRQMDYPAGASKTLEETKETLLRLYEGDSVFHQCWMTRAETGLTIRPIEDVQVISHGDRHLGMGACFHGNFFTIFLMVS